MHDLCDYVTICPKSPIEDRVKKRSRTGPIPGTRSSSRTDENGVTWILVHYSLRGIETTFSLRMDIESVDVSKIDAELKQEHAIYRRALERGRGDKRWLYEKECNEVGFALISLNPQLRGLGRGLLQRAVDSFRNLDHNLASRRVRKYSEPEANVNEEFDPVNDIEVSKLVTVANNATSSTEKSPLVWMLLYDPMCKRQRRINLQFGRLDVGRIPDAFKREYAVFPRVLDSPRQLYPNREQWYNEIGYLIACLNVKVFTGRKDQFLRFAVYCYKQAAHPRAQDVGRYHWDYDILWEYDVRQLEQSDVGAVVKQNETECDALISNWLRQAEKHR